MMFAIPSKEEKKGCSWVEWLCCKSRAEVAWVQDWSNIPEAFFPFLESVFLQEKYISAIQKEYDCSLVLFRYDQRPAGVAVFFKSTFYTEDWRGGEEWGTIARWLARKWEVASQEQSVLVCGNPFVSGPHGFQFDEQLSAEVKADLLCRAMDQAADELQKQGNKIAICLIKDFTCYNKDLVVHLKKCGFGSVGADPIMVLPILPQWNSFEDYTDGLISKFRSKALTAYKKSAEVTSKELTDGEMSSSVEQWYPLYEQVYRQSANRWTPLTATTLIQMKQSLAEAMVFTGYYWNNSMVGFSIAILDDAMEAHLVGMDYNVSKELYLYSRMLYDFVQMGISHQSKQIVFGRTAVEIKSAMGAVPVELGNVMRHSRSIPNLFVRWITHSLEYETDAIRKPWKQTEEAMIHERIEKWRRHE
jgi:phosphoglycolate phosphatase-like HAD superfamily hydrolase